MTDTILYFVGLIFLLFTYYYVTTIAVSVGVRNGLALFAAQLLPYLLQQGQQTTSASALSDAQSQEVLDVLEAEHNGEISSENAAKLLRNIRGEK